MGVHGLGSLEDDDLPLPALSLNEPRFGALGKVEILPQSVQTMQPIVQIDRNHPHRFHRVVANPQQRQHNVYLLNGDRIVLICVEDSDCGHHEDGKHQQCDIVVGHVTVENIVIVVLLNEEIVVFLNNNLLPADKFGLLEGVQEVVVEVGSLLY